MEVVKKHFEDEAKEFDDIIIKIIPCYPEMINALVSAIPFDKSMVINVADIGCGTGTVSKKIKGGYPQATITCMDIAESMIETAKIKLNKYADVRYQIADFRNYEFDDTYDVMVSSLALHHLATDEDKIGFYRKIYESLRPNGIFFNADVILGSNECIQDTYLEKWKSFMKKSISEEEIENKWLHKYSQEDHPAKLINQLDWLRELGFSGVDVIWKYYNFAVYGGCKTSCTKQSRI